MKYIVIGIMIGILASCVPVAHMAFAQQNGFLDDSDVAPPASDSMLPPGAVIEGSYVLHTIQSRQENLHLLASFYYGNPREWRKIYDDNRDVIINPNRLPVGEVIRIHVGDNWQPMVAYEKWFALAVRNGEWQPGVAWQRANTVPVPLSPPPRGKSPSAPGEATVETSTPEQMSAPTPTPQPQTATVPAEAPPSEHPEQKPTSAEEAPEPEPTPPAEDADSPEQEETSTEEETPAEPAF